MQAQELARKMKKETAPTIVDVRSRLEYRSGHIPGAVHAPFLKVVLRLAKLPKDKKQLLVVTCEHGPRAQMAISLFSKLGYTQIDLLEGHMAGWRKSRLPLEK